MKTRYTIFHDIIGINISIQLLESMIPAALLLLLLVTNNTDDNISEMKRYFGKPQKIQNDSLVKCIQLVFIILMMTFCVGHMA